jgi:hypothetical protein
VNQGIIMQEAPVLAVIRNKEKKEAKRRYQ